MLRRCIGVIVTVALVVCISIAPVGAINLDSSATFSLFGLSSPVSVTFPVSGNKVPSREFSKVIPEEDIDIWLGVYDINFSIPPATVSGSVGAYVSFVFTSLKQGTFSSFSGGFNANYSIADTSTYTVPATLSTFNFSSGTDYIYSPSGVTIKLNLKDIDVLTSLAFVRSGSGGWRFKPSEYGQNSFEFVVPSMSVVYTESSADLESLENIADQIAAGNDIAQAMYGDIMEALNAISGDTELIASYINDCLTYLASIDNKTLNIYNLCSSYLHNLADIAQTAEDIEAELQSFHSDFMSKMELLIGTITSESDDIQATMDRIYEQMIAWLETNFKEAISPEFEGSNSDLNQGIANNDAIEQEWTGSLSDTWSAMHISDFTFDSSFTSGFMWVSGWFSNIYNSLGLYGSIVILPLIIGICKLLLGYFRFAGHGHSKGGGDVGA